MEEKAAVGIPVVCSDTGIPIDFEQQISSIPTFGYTYLLVQYPLVC